MFLRKFFAARFFLPRFFPGVGGTPAELTATFVRLGGDYLLSARPANNALFRAGLYNDLLER